MPQPKAPDFFPRYDEEAPLSRRDRRFIGMYGTSETSEETKIPLIDAIPDTGTHPIAEAMSMAFDSSPVETDERATGDLERKGIRQLTVLKELLGQDWSPPLDLSILEKATSRDRSFSLTPTQQSILEDWNSGRRPDLSDGLFATFVDAINIQKTREGLQKAKPSPSSERSREETSGQNSAPTPPTVDQKHRPNEPVNNEKNSADRAPSGSTRPRPSTSVPQPQPPTPKGLLGHLKKLVPSRFIRTTATALAISTMQPRETSQEAAGYDHMESAATREYRETIAQERLEAQIREAQRLSEQARIMGILLATEGASAFNAARQAERDHGIEDPDLYDARPHGDSWQNHFGHELSIWLYGDPSDRHEPTVDLSSVDLEGVDLSNLDLSFLTFTDANMSRANLTGAKLRNTKFINTDLREARIADLNAGHTAFSHCDLRGATITDIRSHGSEIDFTGSLFDETTHIETKTFVPEGWRLQDVKGLDQVKSESGRQWYESLRRSLPQKK